MRYTLNDVAAAFDNYTYSLGNACVKEARVLGHTHTGQSIESEVSSKTGTIFRTRVVLPPPGQPVSFQGVCSCGAKSLCSHIAASLIACLPGQNRTSSTSSVASNDSTLPLPNHGAHAVYPSAQDNTLAEDTTDYDSDDIGGTDTSNTKPKNKWPFAPVTFSAAHTTAPKQVQAVHLPATTVIHDDVRPRPVLVLDNYQGYDFAQVVFNYEDILVPADGIGGGNILTKATPSGPKRIARQNKVEAQFCVDLEELGFFRPKIVSYKKTFSKEHPLYKVLGAFELENESAWLAFSGNGVAQLKKQGWVIDKRLEYRFDISEINNWYANVDDDIGGSGKAWFEFELGIEVDGEKVSLLPVLIDLIRKAPDKFSTETLANYDDAAQLLVTLPNNAKVLLPWGRLKPILLTLGELYFTEKSEPTVRMSTLDASRLAELEDALSLRWMGGDKMLALGRKFREFESIEMVAPPVGLCATLRTYQHEGLSWLQFLREYGLAGILADDMGLGKTLQTLAHVLMEKEEGRLDRPALIVAPTSLMDNWQEEAEKFTPSLRILVLHGNERMEKFIEIPTYDIVLTTFGLLHRDEAKYKKHKFHMIVLDESQNIKNAKTLAAHSVSLLHARHRLCLTGTPLENHLGELWSQFNFLMPGLLGDRRAFNRDYRKPIEKEANDARRAFLVRRINPFMLRRTKAMVASELQDKVRIIKPVEIQGAQRDLYETVRLAMDKKVRDEVAQKGVARSQIVILEALLKLRQVCCDPRLVKSLDKTKTAPASAKLNDLLQLLDEKLADGKRILVFSSFTSMLDLIGQELVQKNIAYARLDGSTRARGKVIKSFQEKQVPVFLISLKAGGVGLNLTAADTVIHYDPWWNPAAEDQATDRAHRIGQDKEVTVYKLIARGTVEEKIQELQQNKADLANSILAGGSVKTLRITQDDLDAIFAPISDDLPLPHQGASVQKVADAEEALEAA